MFLNILKSINKFSSTSRKYKDLESTATYCIDKLKFFIGYNFLVSNNEDQDHIEYNKDLDLNEQLEGPINAEIKNIISYVDKRKVKEIDFDEYEKYLHLVYPYILSPIYKACKQYSNSKLTVISLDGIQKLLSFKRLVNISIDKSKLYGCGELYDLDENVNGFEFLIRLLFDIYNDNNEDESISIHIIRISVSLIGTNIDYFDCSIFYSIILAMLNIYSNTIDNGIRNSSYSVLVQLIDLFFDDSLAQKEFYIRKYFNLTIEVLYILSMTNSMIYIRKQEDNSRKLKKIRFISPINIRLHSEEFIEFENNFFKFNHNVELDPRVSKIRNVSLELISLIYKKYDENMCFNNEYLSDYIENKIQIHMLCILKNTVLSDPLIRLNSVKLWSTTINIFDIEKYIRFHGIYISKCIKRMFECNLVDYSEKTRIIEILFDNLIGNEKLFILLFQEYDLNENNENLILNLLNYFMNILMENTVNRIQFKNLQENLFLFIIQLLDRMTKYLKRKKFHLNEIDIDQKIVLVKKYLLNEYLDQFNNGRYSECIELISDISLINEQDNFSIAKLLANNKYISKKSIGDYISLPYDENKQVLREYCDLFSFKDQNLDYSLYIFLSNFHLPGEAQKIDRIIEQFSLKYYNDNSELFPNKDSVYILAFSLIMLHTDAHSKEIKDDYRMTKSDFIKNNNGLLISSQYSINCLESYYENVTLNEWIFDYSINQAVFFPFFEYFLNFIGNIQVKKEENNLEIKHNKTEFNVKIINYDLLHKITSLMSINNIKDEKILNLIDYKIKKKYQILFFNHIYTESLIHWKFISNKSSQILYNINNNLLNKKSFIINDNTLENFSFSYDGIRFKKIPKVSQNFNIIQSANSLTSNLNSSKWLSNAKICGTKTRDLNVILQICITELVKQVYNEDLEKRKIKTENYVLLSNVLCCYFTEMFSNIDFWIYLTKETTIYWINIIKLITEISLILKLEVSYTTTLTILSYLTNIITLPLKVNDLFFCNSNLTKQIRNILNNEIDFSSEGYSEILIFPELTSNNKLHQYIELIYKSLQANLIENEPIIDENEESCKLLTQTQNSDLLNCIITNESFSTQIVLNSLNLLAIKSIFEIAEEFGDKLTYTLWTIVIGIISQIDRYFYIKSAIKTNDIEFMEHFDYNKIVINKNKEYGNDIVDFLKLSKIRINTTKNDLNKFNSVNSKIIKTTKNIFYSTKIAIHNSSNSINNSQLTNSSNQINDEFTETNEKNNDMIIYGKNNQYIQIYNNLRNSIFCNNLWYKKEELVENQSLIGDDEILWIDNEKYNFIINNISLANLRRIDRYNSEMITSSFELHFIMEKLLSNITAKHYHQRTITNFFVALLFNARIQIITSGRKSLEPFLFKKTFEIINSIVELFNNNFYDIILWDNCFIPCFYDDLVLIFNHKTIIILLDLIKNFVIKFIKVISTFIRNKNNFNDENKVLLIISNENNLRLIGKLKSYFYIYPSNQLIQTHYSVYYLFKKLLDVCLSKFSYMLFISIIELLVDNISIIMLKYQKYNYYNSKDYYDILKIYYNIVFKISENKLRNKDNCESSSNKKEKFFNIITSNSNVGDIKNDEYEILFNITTNLMLINQLILILNDEVFGIIMDILFKIIEIVIGKNNRLIIKLTDYILFIFYIKIRSIYKNDTESLLIQNDIKEWKTQHIQDIKNKKFIDITFNLSNYEYLLKYFDNYCTLITKYYVIKNKYLDLYYYNIINISKIINYWLNIAFNEYLVKDNRFIQKLISKFFDQIFNYSKKLQFNYNTRNLKTFENRDENDDNQDQDEDESENQDEDENQDNSESENRESQYDEAYIEYKNCSLEEKKDNHRKIDFNHDEDDDDEDNYFVDDESESIVIQSINCNSNCNNKVEKSNFEVTNKSFQLDNTQLTFTNMDELKIKDQNHVKLNMSFNKKIKEKNKLSDLKNHKFQIITDKILESSYYLDIKNIKFEECNGNLIKIIYNIYKIIEYYIYRLNIKLIKPLLEDWLYISNKIFLCQVMDIFSKEDIKMQYNILIINIRTLYNNRNLYSYKEWSLVIKSYVNIILEFTNNILIDEKSYINGDIKNRYSIDDSSINYNIIDKVKNIKNENNLLEFGKKQSNIELFFKSKLFQKKKYMGMLIKKKSDNYDDNDINLLKKQKNQKTNISLKKLLEINWSCYSHKYINNTGDQEMYDSYVSLRKKLEETILNAIARNNKEKTDIEKPDCIQDLYTTILIIYKIIIDWFIKYLESDQIKHDMNLINITYNLLINSLKSVYSTLLKKLNVIKYDLFQFNLYLILNIQFYLEIKFSYLFNKTTSFYTKNIFLTYESLLNEYSECEKNQNLIIEDDRNSKNSLKKRFSIITANIYFNHYFNKSYDQILKNKINLEYLYRAVINNLLKDILNMENSEYITKNSTFHKLLFDTKFLRDQQLKILSEEVIMKYCNQESDKDENGYLNIK